MEDNCFTMLYWFLLYNKVDQPWVYTCPLLPEPPSHHPSSYPSRSSQSTGLSSPVLYSNFPLAINVYSTHTHTHTSSDGKRLCLQCRRHRFDPWVGKIPWRRKWQPAPVLLPGESHGQYSRKDSDTTEQLTCSMYILTEKLERKKGNVDRAKHFLFL